MIRKFNLTNGVSVVITEELAIKYELDAAVNNADFVSILASIVSAQDRKKGLPDGVVPLAVDTDPPKLHPFQQDLIDRVESGEFGFDRSDEEELKRRFLGERVEIDYDVWGREDD